MVLAPSEHNQENFFRLSVQNFTELLQDFYPDFPDVLQVPPIRIRLVDAPPDEFFSAEDQSKIETIYGDKAIRGVQLAIKNPDIYRAQIRAIFKARQTLFEKADEEYKQSGKNVWSSAGDGDWEQEQHEIAPVEIMIPTTRSADELRLFKTMVDELAQEAGLTKEEYRFGSMLETLDACANINDIAPLCDFISIGSNDLTSETLKCDRNDWIKRQKLTDHSGTNSDPFVVLHPHVAQIIRTAVRKARVVCPGLQVDLCGAHATNLPSLLALHDLDLDGVSAPPSDMNQEGLRTLLLARLFKARIPSPHIPAAKAKRRARRTANLE